MDDYDDLVGLGFGVKEQKDGFHGFVVAGPFKTREDARKMALTVHEIVSARITSITGDDPIETSVADCVGTKH